MELYKIAGMTFAIDACDTSYQDACRDYLTSSPSSDCQFVIKVTKKDIEEEKELYSYPCDDHLACFTRIYRILCSHAISNGGFFLHSAVVEYNNRAYAFIAPSGTGKSTHIKLWRTLLGEDCKIINGDKPLIMPDRNGRFIAYGTPWSGKEGWQRNVGIPLEAICILKRGVENTIEETDSFTAFRNILKQTLIPSTPSHAEQLLSNINRMISTNIKYYVLHCNMDISAALVSFNGMVNRNTVKDSEV